VIRVRCERVIDSDRCSCRLHIGRECRNKWGCGRIESLGEDGFTAGRCFLVIGKCVSKGIEAKRGTGHREGGATEHVQSALHP
jgi:hypothetical protein